MRIKDIMLWGVLMALALATSAFAIPTLSTVSTGAPERCNGSQTSNFVIAQGGNVTPMNISGIAITDAWQGFFGEITGEILLGNNACDKMYNWSLINLSGEVYLSQSNAVGWPAIAGQQICTADEALTGTGSDRTNRTFFNASLTGWDVGGVTIPAACRTWTNVNNASQNASFEEIILTDTADFIYATKIDADTTGFDGATHDFQIIVPDNTSTAKTTYYVYVEFN